MGDGRSGLPGANVQGHVTTVHKNVRGPATARCLHMVDMIAGVKHTIRKTALNMVVQVNVYHISTSC